jgi:hypothetical protein
MLTTFRDLLAKWVAPACSVLLAALTLIGEHDFGEQRQRYPDWKGLWDILDGAWTFPAIVITAGVIVILAVINIRYSNSLTSLKERLDEEIQKSSQIAENISFIVDGLLLGIARKLNYSRNGTCRISLYIKIEDRNEFVFVGRFSWNPELQRKGRNTFLADQGCIAKGWQHEWFFDASVPDNNEDANRHHQKNYNVPIAVSANLKMRAKLYAVRKILNKLDRPIGVLVIESTNREAFTEEFLKRELDQVAEDWGAFIHILVKYLPQPGIARGVGL